MKVERRDSDVTRTKITYKNLLNFSNPAIFSMNVSYYHFKKIEKEMVSF